MRELLKGGALSVVIATKERATPIVNVPHTNLIAFIDIMVTEVIGEEKSTRHPCQNRNATRPTDTGIPQPATQNKQGRESPRHPGGQSHHAIGRRFSRAKKSKHAPAPAPKTAPRLHNIPASHPSTQGNLNSLPAQNHQEKEPHPQLRTAPNPGAHKNDRCYCPTKPSLFIMI